MASLAPRSSSRPARVPEPVVMPPYALRRLLAQIFSPTLLSVLPYLLPRVPRSVKVTVALLLLANIKSFPLVWHARVFWPAIAARARARPSVHPLLPWIPSRRTPKTLSAPHIRLDALPMGRDIFEDKTVCSFRAWFDDCDWNGHMSNSSYSRNLDIVRMTHLSDRFLQMHFDGGWMALGGAAFSFHAEIPALSPYEVHMSVGGWDEKWIYVVARFVSPRKGARYATASELRALAKSVTEHDEKKADAAVRAAKEQRAAAEAAAGKEKLYCTAVSRYVFKSGRKTIPPWLVIATSGYGTYASTRANWDKAEVLRQKTFSAAQADHIRRTGRPLTKDSFISGGGYRRAGILAAYDPARPEGSGEADTRGLGVWQDRASWGLGEWEERRKANVEALRGVGGVVPATSTSSSLSSGQSTPTKSS